MPILFASCFLWDGEDGFPQVFEVAVGANHDFEIAGFQDVVQLVVVEFEQVVGDLERYITALAFLQVDALAGTVDVGHGDLAFSEGGFEGVDEAVPLPVFA